ncbi:ATP-binding protein [Cellulomonas edaphi]|uniref:ATP-binding protein n=1 Tax=Cellulomonas edaphi TaxID=3053468 RepID=A0ABT7S3S2_9CELL|nr:ATP-binding protein [Cellulomons edaphi]MDM7830267.1 ATP-binding protein [Cellulomons edaphi]
MRAERTVDPHYTAVAPARHWAAERLEEAGIPAERRELLVLLVSELVTNAVEHAWPPVVLRVDVDDERIRVEASDSHRDEPVLRDAPPTDPGGRGVWLIDRLASSWGSQLDRSGEFKTVWFELRADDDRGVTAFGA